MNRQVDRSEEVDDRDAGANVGEDELDTEGSALDGADVQIIISKLFQIKRAVFFFYSGCHSCDNNPG